MKFKIKAHEVFGRVDKDGKTYEGDDEVNGQFVEIFAPDWAAADFDAYMKHADESTRAVVKFDDESLAKISPFNLVREDPPDEDRNYNKDAGSKASAKSSSTSSSSSSSGSGYSNEELNAMTVSELRDVADRRDIDLTGMNLKSDIIAAIKKG